MSVKIAIYEDNEPLRSSLTELLLLTGQYEVVHSAENGADAAKAVALNNADVVLMDIDMPGLSGIEAVKQIRQSDRKVAIIMLTIHDDDKSIFDAICAGASGYLLKKDVSEKLVLSIREVMEGGAPMSPAIARMVITSLQRTKNISYALTTKEELILKLLCKGYSYKMIADESELSFETIRTYIKRMYEKLQVHSATQAVSKAIRERLV